MKYIIDRFEEGYAVLSGEKGTVNIERSKLPKEASVGDVIHSDGITHTVDKKETASRKAEMSSRLSALFKRKRHVRKESSMKPEYIKKIQNTKLFVLDMDGTIYLGDKPLEGAADFCKRIIESGRRLLYFTNNASKNPQNYLDKLARLGFPSEREMIMTSGDVTIAFLNEYHKGEPIYLVGTPELEKSFSEKGIPMVKTGEKADIVVVSFDLTLTYEKLSHACTLIRNGAKFYSTHPDINCPTEDGFIPDSGAICGAIELSTGVKPRYFGKPHAETADMIELVTGVPRSEISMVGDRLYTDIALGKKNGINAILVMSGETTEEMLSNALPEEQPDMKLAGVWEMTEEL